MAQDNGSLSPIVYFRHVGQEEGYGTAAGCYGRDIVLNFAIDPRFIYLHRFTKKPGLDRECETSPDNATVTCSGSLNICIGFRRQFYTSIGYMCKPTIPLDINFTIEVVPIPENRVPCTNWSDAFDQLEQPMYPVLRNWIYGCSKIYSQYSRWNMIGLTQHGYFYVFLFAQHILRSHCYQHVFDTECRMIFPECRDGAIIQLCKDTCNDFNAGCSSLYSNVNPGTVAPSFNISCTSLGHLNDPDVGNCSYMPVTCAARPKLRENEVVLRQNGSVATSVADLGCTSWHTSHSHRIGRVTCGYNGQWSQEVFPCNLMLPVVLSLVVVVTVALVVAVCYCVYKYIFELRLLTYKYCAPLLCFCRCRFSAGSKTEKRHHAFIIYHNEQRQFVQQKIYLPLTNAGFNICVDFADFLPNDNLPKVISNAIAESCRIIIILNQSFLDSEWGQYELDQALMQRLEDASLTFLVVLLQNKTTLKHVPRWLRGYLRTNIYIEKTDPFFTRQLILGMPTEQVQSTQSEDLEQLTPEMAACDVNTSL